MDLSSDHGLKMAHAERSLSRENVHCMTFGLSDLLTCEFTFSALTPIKIKQSRLNVEKVSH